MMNNQPHIMAASGTQRNIGIGQRVSAASQSPMQQTAKSAYQLQSSPLTHLAHVPQQAPPQQQSPMLAGYHQKPLSQELTAHHMTQSSSSMASQNGIYHTIQSNSQVHTSNIGIESNQLNLHHGHHQYHQLQQQQLQQQQPSSAQQYHSTQVQQQQQQLPTQAHHQQQLQQQQIQQQLHQRHVQQQQFQKQQQKQLLQKQQQAHTSQSSVAAGTASSSEASNEDRSQEQEDSSQETSSNASETKNLANTKEKTPMCLINELARYNKINHFYTLTDEQGPAHKKTFFVKLKLGEEEYAASGESIKKAQHAAAAIALERTKFDHPPPKPQRISNVYDFAKFAVDGAQTDHITPTVELNALAMKRGEVATYKPIEPHTPYYHPPHPLDYRMMSQRWRYHFPRMARVFYVSLRVGQREFIGDGPTRQAARHAAATKALRILKNLPVPQAVEKKESEEQEEVDDSLKSAISLVHEIALKRNLAVVFDVVRETGPPHMRNFVTTCKVGDFETSAEGNSKKVSKKKAAELMLDELRKLPSLPASANRPKLKAPANKKKNRNLIKSELQAQKADPNYGVGINPISRLIQITQAQKKKEPVYTLVTERGLPRRREFVIQCQMDEHSTTGTGPNKKLAKRTAADNMLQLLGYTRPSPQPAKSAIKTSNNEGSEPKTPDRDKKVTFCDEDDGPDLDQGGGQQQQQQQHQRVPGLLHLPSNVTAASKSASTSGSGKDSVIKMVRSSVRAEVQLNELCKSSGIPLPDIDDFTKKEATGTQHLARITLNTKPPSHFHGNGPSTEVAREMASLEAIKAIMNFTHAAGDGPQVKLEGRQSQGITVRKELTS